VDIFVLPAVGYKNLALFIQASLDQDYKVKE
jgi:hypothetical protein